MIENKRNQRTIKSLKDRKKEGTKPTAKRSGAGKNATGPTGQRESLMQSS